MNELTVFENKDFGQIRAIMQQGEPWFVAADVCKCTDIANSRDAFSRLDEDEKGVALIDTPGGKQNMAIISCLPLLACPACPAQARSLYLD